MSGKVKHVSVVGVATIHASFNNTIISISDTNGNVLYSGSAGACGFKGARKSTSHAAQVVAEYVGKKAADGGMKTVSVRLKGPGAGRESSIRMLSTMLDISGIVDVTPAAHNGCRPPKRPHT